MMLVNHDNRLLLERINNVQPLYDRRIWKKDDKRNRHIVKNLSKFYPDENFLPNSQSSGKKGGNKNSSNNIPKRPATTNKNSKHSMNKRGGNGRRIVDKSNNIEGKPQTAVGIVSTGKTLVVEKPEETSTGGDSVPVTSKKEDEIQQAAKTVEESQPPKSEEQKTVEAIFKTIDPNHNGVISRRKFLRSVQLNTQVQTLLGSNEKLKHLTHSKEIYDKFKEMDDNNDKEVTIEEMLSYAQ